MAFDHKHYLPILKGKEAEYLSLRDLPAKVKSRLTPLIEVPPLPWDYVDDCPAKTLDEHLGRIAPKVENSWGTDREFFLELDPGLFSLTLPGGIHPLAHLLSLARARAMRAIPVTSLGRDQEYQGATREGVRQDRRGVCLRLTSEDLNVANLEREIDRLLETIRVAHEETDLILDFGAMGPAQAGTMTIAARAILPNLPNLRRWRTLTFAATAFPENLIGFAPNTMSRTPRAEWVVWVSLVGDRRSIPRLPTFGDYAIQHPEITEIDPRIMQMSANLRYTADADWLILKGRNVNTHGYEQFIGLCKALVQRPEYSGPKFSWGDGYIRRCADEEDGPGNAMTWRRVGTSHHLTFVTEQIANLRGL